ncbi:MAG TPA: AsmA family protein [Burkholderiales bacterium]|jgi:uncharacterized protein involved in outer membrane biogenesis|nr:AsmA family protein [Burkholderiales bacterium]
MSLRRSITIALAAVGALLLAILLYLAFGDLSRHKGRIESLVTEALGRPFAIDGAFELKVLPSILVRAERVRLGNVPGGSAPQMVEVGRFSAQVGLWSLVSGPVDVRSFELSDVSVVLEKDAEGKGNWVFGEETAAAEEVESGGVEATKVPAVILRAKLDSVRVTYREPGKPERVALLETFTIESAADGLFAVAGKGRLDDYPASLAGDLGPLSALVSGRDIRMAMQASLGNLRLDLKGALGRLDPLDGADLTLKVANPDLGGMLKKLQLPVFATGALRFDARLSDAGELTRLEVDAKLGDIAAKADGTLSVLGLSGSDLRFEVSVADAARLAAAFGVEGLPAGVAKASGRVASSRTEIKLDAISAQYAGAKATADGTIRTSGKPGAAIRFKAAVESLATLREGLPAMPLQMSGIYADSRARIEVKDLKARVGGNEIAASASMTRTGKRRIEADVTSPVLDLTPFLATETKSKAKPPPKAAAKKFVFGEEPLPLGMLKGPDTRLHLALGELKLGAGSLKDVDGTLRLGAGQLALEGHARGGVDGSLSGSVVLSQQGGGAAGLDLKATATRFRAGFGAGGEIQPGETPPTSVEATLQTRGASARQMAAGAKGRFLVTLGPGRVKAGMLDLLGSGLIGELAGKLNPFAAKDPYTRLDCVVTRADVVDGHVTASPVLLQIEKVTVVAYGKVDLHSEALALNFNTRPRKGIGISPGMFTNPFIEVAGTMVNPRIGVSAKGVTAGAAAAATGGATVVAQGFWDRLRGEKDLCGPTLAEVGATMK